MTPATRPKFAVRPSLNPYTTLRRNPPDSVRCHGSALFPLMPASSLACSADSRASSSASPPPGAPARRLPMQVEVALYFAAFFAEQMRKKEVRVRTDGRARPTAGCAPSAGTAVADDRGRSAASPRSRRVDPRPRRDACRRPASSRPARRRPARDRGTPRRPRPASGARTCGSRACAGSQWSCRQI